MLILPKLHAYLTQLLSPGIHTALLLTPEGALVSFASDPCLVSPTAEGEATPTHPQSRSKDEIRIVAGLSAEVWAETRGGEAEAGMVESELGRILVLPIEEGANEDQDPLLLLALNASPDVDWDLLQVKAKKLANYLAPSVNKHRGQFATAASTTASTPSKARSNAASPNRPSR
ncbi:hypothetical protein BV22DRAFT_1055001 [Leucogyrophana mollusca]|uniref:Uncharacterized protein n=1 Tax=Leucogyrophana mollusca TaxID=85980 RepID=A0ACB8BZ41_9AGAM|nr:hypothetical protein BV22DRAFT_1055001 [Leucogyrophana mollusca]